ncbi:hypothetical protein C2869_04365 [Saccharobesus litoralis]|uniref:Right handed beta helix domain-containing protein n=1 Tax=Saccharobesus litoralis TaxID=2172099 RepID=A0A2S0VNR3_9ALTE|nr:right-handed parallel beta-helix repeat-containing protein [Saccharobesus litoralis]AWB65720.1 hypothetical protein C2869_04365 [Saccharobesus litoralis]
MGKNIGKLALSALTLSLISTPILAKTIHVSTTGSDSATGAWDKPYQTISHAVNQAVSGDTVLIQGGTYREEVKIENKNNITIKGHDPHQITISGANEVNTIWSEDQYRPGVFKAWLDSNQVETDYTQVFVNGKFEQMARFPDNITGEMLNPMDQKSGYAVIANGSKPQGTNVRSNVTFTWHNGTTPLPNVTFTDEAIVRGLIGKLRNNIFSASKDGADIRNEGHRLLSFIGTNNGPWKNEAAYTAHEGFGYIFDLSVLDRAGEWFYKRNQNVLYYKPANGTMNGLTVEAKRRKWGIRVINSDNIKIENIDVVAAQMEVTNSDDLHVNACSFQYMTPFVYRRDYGVLKEGIVINNSDNGLYENNLIGHTWGSGVILESGQNNTLNNNIIEDIGWLGQFTVSLWNTAENTTITQNTFGRTGRFHIRTTEHVKSTITDNDFFEAMAMGEDAGAIMMTSTAKSVPLDLKDTVIAWNRIHDINGIPAMDSDRFNYSRTTVKALYMEDVNNYTVHHNFIYNINATPYDRVTQGKPVEPDGKPIYLGPRTKHMDKKVHYFNNTFYNYDDFMNIWHMEDPDLNLGGHMSNGSFRNNIMMSGKKYYFKGDYAEITDTSTHKAIQGGNISRIEETSIYDFAQEIAKAPYFYTLHTGTNTAFSESQYSSNFVNPSTGDFSLFTGSAQNSNGAAINGITGGSPVERGAWEGETQWQRDRIFRAGATISATDFPVY